MKKSVLLIVVLCVGMLNLASAHDCHLFTKISIKEIDATLFGSSTKRNPALETITKEGLHRALINLKSHCCASNILNNNPDMLKSCKEDAILLRERTNYPQSPYLFDQLIDVMMRRLAVDGAYEEVPVDEKAQERRKKTDELADKAEGTIPVALSKSYKEFWSLQPAYLVPEYNGVSEKTFREEIEQLESTRPLYSKPKERNLTSKYLNLCQSAIYLMTLFPISFNSKELVYAQAKCHQLTKQAIDNEASYLAQLIVHKSDLLLAQAMKEYADDYLMVTRAQNFQEGLVRMLSNLFGVIRMVPKLQPICN